MLSQINEKRIKNVSCRFENYLCGFEKRVSTISKKNVSRLTVCGFETTCWALCGVKTYTSEVETTWQLLLCGFKICLFLFDRTARINTTEVLTCRGSFGGFETTCFQLDRAASFETPEFPTVEQVAASESEIALASDVLPSTYCLNEEDFVASLLSGDKTGVASSAGSLDEDTPLDALAEQDMELYHYRSHKASFSMQAFPPYQKLTAS